MQFINLLKQNNAKITNIITDLQLKGDHVLVASIQDLASTTMMKYLKTRMGFKESASKSHCSPLYKNIKLHIDSESLLHLENLDEIYPDASSFIFLSKHRSDSGIPTLTCHCTGNFADNPYGGNSKELAIAYPSLQKCYLKAITAAKQMVPEYDIVIEATHHGPTSLKKPVLFVELGSSEKQWADCNATMVICDSLLKVLENGIEHCERVGIALGSTHYPSKFNRLLIDSDIGLAAIASKHNLKAIDEAMLGQMITKSVEPVTQIVIDIKGLGSQKERIMKMVEKTSLNIVRV